MVKKVISHILRWWDKDTDLPHPLMHLVPPFLLEILLYLFVGTLIYSASRAVFKALIG